MCVTMFWQGRGSFADECLVAADSAFAVPDGLTDAEAAGFWIPHLTGWIGLVDRGQIAAGDWLAVLGASGGSGIAAIQLGHALGAQVIAVVSDEERAAFCRELGADATSTAMTAPSPRRCASRPVATAPTSSMTRSVAPPPRSGVAPWPGTAGCWRWVPPAAPGRTWPRTTS